MDLRAPELHASCSEIRMKQFHKPEIIRTANFSVEARTRAEIPSFSHQW